jgi:hypothetical protein
VPGNNSIYRIVFGIARPIGGIGDHNGIAGCNPRRNRYRPKNQEPRKTARATAESALNYLRDEERKVEQRRRDGTRLGGMITVAAGIGLVVFLRAVLPDIPVYLVALVPILVGTVLIVFAQMIGPRT